MKIKQIILLFFTGLILQHAKAQNADPSRYNNFYEYIIKGFKPPDTVKKSCEWQYALVEVFTNQSNKVIKYNVLNKVSGEFRKSFGYLIGYQFSKKIIINKHPVVFCISIDSQKSSCILSKKQYSGSEVLSTFFSDLAPLLETDPKAIILPRILMESYSFDSIR